MKYVAIILPFILILAGCRATRYVEVPVTKTVTETRLQTDTVSNDVYVHDSVIVHAHSDTVYVERWHTNKQKQQAARIIRHDSIVVDSVRIPYPVERKVTRWERTKQNVGGAAIGIVMAGAVIALIYLFKYLRTR